MRPMPASDEMGAVLWTRLHRSAPAAADLDPIKAPSTFLTLGGMISMTSDLEMVPRPIPPEAS